MVLGVHTPWSLDTLPWLVPVVSLPSQMRCTQTPVGAHTPQKGGWPGGEETEAVAAGKPQSAPEGLFLFGKILLLNPATPSIQGRACPLAQPTSPARPGTVCIRAQHGPTLNSSASTHGLRGFTTLSLFSSLRPQATRSLLVLLKPCLAGEGAVNLALPGILWQARVWAWGFSCPGP